MANANTAAFLDGDGADFQNPFQNAPSSVDDQPNPNNPGGISNNELRRRQQENERQGNATANANAPGLAKRATQDQWNYENDLAAAEVAGMSVADYRAKRAHDLERSQHSSLVRNIIQDPWTLGVLSAPYAVVGGGAAVGGAAALGFGEGAAIGGAGAAGAGGAATGAGVHGAGIGAATAGTAGTSTGYIAPTAAGLGAAAAPTAAAAGGAAAPAAAAGGVTASDVINGIGLAGSLTIAALDQKKSAAEKALIAKQEQMAQEAAKRREQMQTAGMNALGQRLLAFNPQNQMMAKMYGPEAAFAPEQFAAMAENPMGPPVPDADIVNGGQGDPQKEARVAEYQQKLAAYQQEEQRRKQMVMQGITPVGQGPAPLQARTPQAARKF